VLFAEEKEVSHSLAGVQQQESNKTETIQTVLGARSVFHSAQ